MRTAFLKKGWLSNAAYLGLLSTVSLQDCRVFAKTFDMAVREVICASGMVAEKLTQQKSQFELSL